MGSFLYCAVVEYLLAFEDCLFSRVLVMHWIFGVQLTATYGDPFILMLGVYEESIFFFLKGCNNAMISDIASPFSQIK